MKKSILLFVSILISISVYSQGNFYFGFEAGSLFELHHYSNEDNYSRNQFFMGGASAPLLGYEFKAFSIETGVYVYLSRHPYRLFDFNYNKIVKAEEKEYSIKNFVIPFRIGKNFTLRNKKYSIKPEVGISVFMRKGKTDDNITKGWYVNNSEYYSINDSVIRPINGTLAYVHEDEKFGLGIETSLSFVYQINAKFECYFRGSYITQINPIYSETIVHTYYDEELKAANEKRNIALLQLGIRVDLNDHKE